MHGAPSLTERCEALLAPRLEQRIVPGLDRVQSALRELGGPQFTFPAMLVVGTNGKGSVAALVSSILGAHGRRVGLFTSPHLVRIEERVRIDGRPIESDRLLGWLERLARFPDLSYFETMTVAAVLEFAARRVDIAVLEAGLGGRWDATNALDPVVSLLTNVGTDHQEWLGHGRERIAVEKATALRGREAIVGRWDDEVETVIRAAASPATPVSLAAEWTSVSASGRAPSTASAVSEDVARSGLDPGTEVRGREGAAERPPFLIPGSRSSGQAVAFRAGDVRGEAILPLLGEHQLENLSLALAGVVALAHHGVIAAPEVDGLRRGIEAVRWPGRLQWRRWNGSTLLLDGAHNVEATRALSAALDEFGLSRKVHLLFSCLSDKPEVAIAELLRPRVASVTVTTVASPRTVTVERLARAFPGARIAPSVDEALASLPRDLPALVTGSLRLVGEVLSLTGGDGD